MIGLKKQAIQIILDFNKSVNISIITATKKEKHMNKLITSIILVLALLISPVFLTGCATNGTPEEVQAQNIKRIATGCKTAAYIGSAVYLQKHPEHKDKFVAARNSLAVLESTETLDFTALLAIVSQLPVEKLESPEATIAITGATMLLTDYAGELNLEQINKLKPVVTAIKEGIDLALVSVP